MSFWLLEVFFTAGLLLGFSGVVRLSVRKMTGAWKEGGAAASAGGVIVGVLVVLEMARSQGGAWYDKLWGLMFLFIMIGLVLVFSGLVQLLIRNGTGLWKEGGGSLLAGVIVAVVSVLSPYTSYVLLPGLVLAVNGAVQLCVRKKIGRWEEGGASLLAGVIVVGGTILFWKVLGMSGFELLWWGRVLNYCSMAGLILLFSGVVRVCVRNRTGKWKEGGASLLAGVIIAGTPSVWLLVGFLVTLLR